MSASSFLPFQHRAEALPAYQLQQKRVQGRAKRGRGKAVTWPPEDQICQVRLFLSNDVPSSIGCGQNVLHMKQLLGRSSPPQSSTSGGVGVAHTMPPGFRSSLVKRTRIDTHLASMATQAPWAHPQKLVLNSVWLVADGDQSKEAGLQKQRELRVLEAFYPRLTSIPDSPAEPMETCTDLHDSLIPTIPLVPIEEEEDDEEPGKGFETSEKLHVLDCPLERGKLMEGQVPDSPASTTSSPFAQESIQHVHNSSSSNAADLKVAAAAAVAATCVAFHKQGATGLVDPDLLVEILRNPTLLKSLTMFNQPCKSPSEALNGHKLSIASLLSQNLSHALQYDGPSNKPCTGAPHNTGLPSPVSVLSDWTHGKSSEIMNAPSLPTMGGSLPSAPSKHSHNPDSTREAVSSLESDPVHGLHAWSHEARVGINASCRPIVSAQTTPMVHADDRSSGMVAPLAPFPSQSAVNAYPNILGRMQPGQGLMAQEGALHHQGMRSLDSTPCRSSYSECRFRGHESSSLCAMTKWGPRTNRLCMYFNTPRGCRNGGNCAFLHPLGSLESNGIAP